MILYFSGTGNSFKIAEILKEELSEEMIFIKEKDDKETIKKIKAEKLGIIVPTYCYDLPEFIEEFLSKLEISEDTYCYAIATCGLEPGNILHTLDEVLKEKGNKLSYAKSIQMPDNCAKILDYETDMEIRHESYEKAIEFAEEISVKKEDRKEIKLDTDIIEEIKMAQLHVKEKWTKKEVIEDRCINCNKCIQVCPTDNIENINGKIVIGDNCINCLACMHWCPEQAVKMEEVIFDEKDSYTNPEIKYRDFINR